MFTDPQSITPTGGSAVSMPRTSSALNSGAFKSLDTGSGGDSLSISHSYGKGRARHTIRLTDTKLTTDPFLTGSSFIASMSASLTIDVPDTGYTPAQAAAICGGLYTLLSASTNAATVKLIGGES
jgi:hypothetical protein